MVLRTIMQKQSSVNFSCCKVFTAFVLDDLQGTVTISQAVERLPFNCAIPTVGVCMAACIVMLYSRASVPVL